MEKLQLSCLPTQSGKTFVAINELLANRSNTHGSLHIVLTMNDLMNNSQTVYRVGEHVDPTKIAILSCKKMTKSYNHIRNVKQFNTLCMKKGTPEVVFACSNPTRISHINTIIESLKNTTTRVFIYMDEMHKYINSTRKFVETALQNPTVEKILGLTATPQSIWTHGELWSSVSLLQNEDPSFDSDYVSLKHLSYVHTEWCDVDGVELTHRMMKPSRDVISYFKFVVEKYPEIFDAGTRVFIPANVKQIVHSKVRTYIFDRFRYAVIVVINSTEKTISFYDEVSRGIVSKKLSLKTEINKSIYNACIENELDLTKRTLCIVGFNCLGMGQTLMNDQLGCFTSAIIGRPNITNDEMYQLYGRLTGRMRNWGAKYCQTVVYCNEESKSIVFEMEKCTLNARANQGAKGFTYNDYIEPIQNSDILTLFNNQQIRELVIERRNNRIIPEEDKGFMVFDTQEEAIAFAQDEFEKTFHKRKTNEAPKFMQKNGKNRSQEELVAKMCGINKRAPIIMTVTDEYRWIVYWQISLMEIE